MALLIGGVAGLVIGFALDQIRQAILLRHGSLAGHSEDGIIYILPAASILGAVIAIIIVRRRSRRR